MAKLGYTWYPNDWGNSEKVFELNLSERGFYRELIDIAMKNDNKIDVKIEIWARKFGEKIDEIKSILDRLIEVGVIEFIDEKTLQIPSCEQRLIFIRSGKKGGEKSTKNKGSGKGAVKGNGNQRERERERERENKYKEKGKRIASDEKNISFRKENFYNSLKPFVKDYGKSLVRRFFDYWTEKSTGDEKMKFEKEKSFEISKRLSRWKNNEPKFNPHEKNNEIIEVKLL